jgi:hypothetical protein
VKIIDSGSYNAVGEAPAHWYEDAVVDQIRRAIEPHAAQSEESRFIDQQFRVESSAAGDVEFAPQAFEDFYVALLDDVMRPLAGALMDQENPLTESRRAELLGAVSKTYTELGQALVVSAAQGGSFPKTPFSGFSGSATQREQHLVMRSLQDRFAGEIEKGRQINPYGQTNALDLDILPDLQDLATRFQDRPGRLGSALALLNPHRGDAGRGRLHLVGVAQSGALFAAIAAEEAKGAGWSEVGGELGYLVPTGRRPRSSMMPLAASSFGCTLDLSQVKPGDTVVLIDDVIVEGASIDAAIEAIAGLFGDQVKVIIGVPYGFGDTARSSGRRRIPVVGLIDHEGLFSRYSSTEILASFTEVVSEAAGRADGTEFLEHSLGARFSRLSQYHKVEGCIGKGGYGIMRVGLPGVAPVFAAVGRAVDNRMHLQQAGTGFEATLPQGLEVSDWVGALALDQAAHNNPEITIDLLTVPTTWADPGSVHDEAQEHPSGGLATQTASSDSGEAQPMGMLPVSAGWVRDAVTEAAVTLGVPWDVEALPQEPNGLFDMLGRLPARGPGLAGIGGAYFGLSRLVGYLESLPVGTAGVIFFHTAQLVVNTSEGSALHYRREAEGGRYLDPHTGQWSPMTDLVEAADAQVSWLRLDDVLYLRPYGQHTQLATVAEAATPAQPGSLVINGTDEVLEYSHSDVRVPLYESMVSNWATAIGVTKGSNVFFNRFGAEARFVTPDTGVWRAFPAPLPTNGLTTIDPAHAPMWKQLARGVVELRFATGAGLGFVVGRGVNHSGEPVFHVATAGHVMVKSDGSGSRPRDLVAVLQDNDGDPHLVRQDSQEPFEVYLHPEFLDSVSVVQARALELIRELSSLADATDLGDLENRMAVNVGGWLTASQRQSARDIAVVLVPAALLEGHVSPIEAPKSPVLHQAGDLLVRLGDHPGQRNTGGMFSPGWLMQSWFEPEADVSFLGTTLDVSPGLSGSPTFNIMGELIGIAVATENQMLTSLLAQFPDLMPYLPYATGFGQHGYVSDVAAITPSIAALLKQPTSGYRLPLRTTQEEGDTLPSGPLSSQSSGWNSLSAADWSEEFAPFYDQLLEQVARPLAGAGMDRQAPLAEDRQEQIRAALASLYTELGEGLLQLESDPLGVPSMFPMFSDSGLRARLLDRIAEVTEEFGGELELGLVANPYGPNDRFDLEVPRKLVDAAQNLVDHNWSFGNFHNLVAGSDLGASRVHILGVAQSGAVLGAMFAGAARAQGWGGKHGYLVPTERSRFGTPARAVNFVSTLPAGIVKENDIVVVVDDATQYGFTRACVVGVLRKVYPSTVKIVWVEPRGRPATLNFEGGPDRVLSMFGDAAFRLPPTDLGDAAKLLEASASGQSDKSEVLAKLDLISPSELEQQMRDGYGRRPEAILQISLSTGKVRNFALRLIQKNPPYPLLVTEPGGEAVLIPADWGLEQWLSDHVARHHEGASVSEIRGRLVRRP